MISFRGFPVKSADTLNTWYLHKKTGKRYAVLAQGLDATNSRDGTEIMIYFDREGRFFAREKQEFLEKFTPDERYSHESG